MLRPASILLVLALACGASPLDAAGRATTPAEERAAFAALARPGLGLVAYDAAGDRLDLGEARWWERAHRLELSLGGQTRSHVLLAPENVLLLLGE